MEKSMQVRIRTSKAVGIMAMAETADKKTFSVVCATIRAMLGEQAYGNAVSLYKQYKSL